MSITNRVGALIAAGLIVLVSAGAAIAAAPQPIQVMVLGTFHMDNPGRDLNNAHVDPVTSPAKQAELERVAKALAAFHPTAIAVERMATDQNSLMDQKYPAFTPADLTANADERVQIGYRLAHEIGLTRVYAVDEQEADGEASYFPYEAVQTWAAAHGKSAELDALHAPVQAWDQRFEAAQKTRSLGDLLYEVNTPGEDLYLNGWDFYYRVLSFGDGRNLPGADLNSRWYDRNAKIFAKLMRVAKPGDRIVVIFGSGHADWLRQLAANTPGFVNVAPGRYLSAARRLSARGVEAPATPPGR